ncbi:MAG TPA: diguanylate cyclase [Terriglobales bacterium]|nr:diguanylate cyclase [Terriglobales bacterium]
MPQPGEASQPQPSPEDSFLDLLTETLEGLDESVRGQFLRQFFRTIAQIDLAEAQSNEYWHRILQRRRELSDSLGRTVSLKTAMVDVLASTNFLRVPILMEYDEFKKLQINAATDALTGLYNRRLFDEYCEKELNRAQRYNQQLAIVILDAHKLKQVNDRHGHLQGDQVLQLAASTLRKTLRASDFAFRIGGDEFAVLLPQTDPEQATTLCRRIRTQYESEIRMLKLDLDVTLDFGVAVHPQDGDQKAALLSLADKRLYEMKYAGTEPGRAGVPPRAASPESPFTRDTPTGEASSRETPGRDIPGRESPTREFPSRETPSREVPSRGGGFRERTHRDVPPPKYLPVEPKFFVPTGSVPPGGPVVPSSAPSRSRSEHRKWERVSLAGTKAYAVLSDASQKNATVVDLSYGGVALLLDKPDDLPSQFSAILHVPILPPVRVVLHKAYTQRVEGGRARIGCAFVS